MNQMLSIFCCENRAQESVSAENIANPKAQAEVGQIGLPTHGNLDIYKTRLDIKNNNNNNKPPHPNLVLISRFKLRGP